MQLEEVVLQICLHLVSVSRTCTFLCHTDPKLIISHPWSVWHTLDTFHSYLQISWRISAKSHCPGFSVTLWMMLTPYKNTACFNLRKWQWQGMYCLFTVNNVYTATPHGMYCLFTVNNVYTATPHGMYCLFTVNNEYTAMPHGMYCLFTVNNVYTATPHLLYFN